MLPTALDLFCGAGGSSMGLSQAGFQVTGIDINRQPEYPFLIYNFDVLTLGKDRHSLDWLRAFDFIWASPPCQAFSTISFANKSKGFEYPDLIEPTRDLLKKIGKPYCIENVRDAPLKKKLILCGEMFGLRVIRHRYFEIEGFRCVQPFHQKHRGKVLNPKIKGFKGRRKDGYYFTVTGHDGTAKEYREAMGIDWMKNLKSITEAVPPAYSKYIGKEFINGLDK